MFADRKDPGVDGVPGVRRICGFLADVLELAAPAAWWAAGPDVSTLGQLASKKGNAPAITMRVNAGALSS